MVPPEQQIATIEGISSNTRNTNYTLHLTSNRMIFIKKYKPTHLTGVGGFLGGFISETIFYIHGNRAKKEEKKCQNLTIEEKLAQVKGCFAINYKDIKEVRLHACWNSEFSISLINSKVNLFWTEKKQIDQLADTLAKVGILQDKIFILK